MELAQLASVNVGQLSADVQKGVQDLLAVLNTLKGFEAFLPAPARSSLSDLLNVLTSIQALLNGTPAPALVPVAIENPEAA